MTSNVIPFPEDAISLKEGKAITTSLAVAEVFDKRHKNVLQAIRNLDCSDEFNGLNFQPVNFIDTKGESRPMYEMTRDGWTMLVMGFSGAKAAAFKEAYIERFNQMEQVLLQQAIDDAPGILRAAKRQNQKLKQLVLNDNTRLAQVYRYLVLGLNFNEIGKLLNCSARTVGRDAKRLADCDLLSFPNQFKRGYTQGKHYPQLA